MVKACDRPEVLAGGVRLPASNVELAGMGLSDIATHRTLQSLPTRVRLRDDLVVHSRTARDWC